MSKPEGAGNDAAPLAAGSTESGRQRPVAESTVGYASATADSRSDSGPIDIEITRPKVRLRPPPLRVEAGRFVLTVTRMAGSGARLLVKPRRGRSLEVRAAHELRRTFALMGPTYVKLGQIIASSPGVFPETLSNEFRTLLDRVPPASSELIHESMREQLGADPATIFATFDEKPFASASIAQVHRATLKSGERVVVKIQRPKIRTRLAADVRIIGRLARMIVKTDLGRATNATEIVEDFEQNLNEELDFAAEGHAMEQWYASLADTEYGDKVRVPKVFWEYTTERVLTMEYVEGIRIDNITELSAAGFDGVGLVKAIVYSLFETGFQKGLFHGDLHAGNLLVDANGRIVFLDFGIVGRIDERSRKVFTEIMVDLFVKNDHAAVSRGIYKLGAIGDRAKVVDPKTAAKSISNFTDPLQQSKLSAIEYGQLGKQLADMAKEYDVRLPRELVLIAKQLLYVERYMKLLAPEWALLSDPSFIGYFGNMVIQAEQSRIAEAAEQKN
ncbi:MAG: ABC1 kinase family protein [Mycobacterium sp.]